MPLLPASHNFNYCRLLSSSSSSSSSSLRVHYLTIIIIKLSTCKLYTKTCSKTKTDARLSFGSQNLSKDVPEEEIKYPTNTQSKNRSPDVLPGMFFGCYCCFCFRFVLFQLLLLLLPIMSSIHDVFTGGSVVEQMLRWTCEFKSRPDR